MKRFLLVVLLLSAIALYAQQSSPPDITTPSTAQSIALMQYKAWAETQIAMLWSSTNGQQASVTALQNQVNTLNSQLSALQAKVDALAAPAPVSTTLAFTGIADGPLNGLLQGVTFTSGFWCISSGELMACADGQPQRSIVFPRPVTITSITFSTTTTNTLGIKFTSQSGQVATSVAAPIGQDTVFAPAWSTPVTMITMGANGGTGSAAPDLRVRQIVYTQ